MKYETSSPIAPRSVRGSSNIKGNTSAHAKSGPILAAGKNPAKKNNLKLSGKHWCAKYPTSTSTADLTPPFRENVQKFLKVLVDNGAKVQIEATYRPKERAYLMHWAWMISKSKVKYKDYPKTDPYNIGIVWDHGDEPTSKAKALEMVKTYQISARLKVPPALNTRHTAGKAIDMFVTDLPAVLVFAHDGQEVKADIKGPTSGEYNTALHAVAKKYFLVIKTAPSIDEPHWSEDGR